jgi:hypothetical protein
LREGKKHSLFREILYEEFERYVKQNHVKGQLSRWRPYWEIGGGSFTETFERKRKCLSGFLFFDPEEIKN